ncbi:MAG: acyl-CoA dehydrogenase family protein [Microthrixaceae bacterium]
MTDPVAIAHDIAENLLFPAALSTDRADLVALENLDALADAGLYGMFGPVETGGSAADLVTAGAVVEQLASGCLTTALVWLQHHGLVGNLLLGDSPLREAWLPELCSGERRSGIVFAGLLPGPATLQAVRIDGGWRLDGTAPWVSGWGRIDTLQVAACGQEGLEETVATVAISDLDDARLTACRHELAVLDASGTVRLSFDGVTVEDSHLLSIASYQPGATNALSLRLNGSLALGVASRCISLLGQDAVAGRRAWSAARRDPLHARQRRRPRDRSGTSCRLCVRTQGCCHPPGPHRKPLDRAGQPRPAPGP